MKKIKTLTLLVLLFAVFVVPLTTPKATVNLERFVIDPLEHIPGIYWGIRELNGNYIYRQFGRFYRQSDHQLAYHVDETRGPSMSGNFQRRENVLNYLNLTSEEWHRVRLLAFYGFGHEHRTHVRWFTVTQFLINNIMIRDALDMFMTNQFRSRGTNDFSDLQNELNAVVNQNKTMPSFRHQDFTTYQNKPLLLEDTNEVLEHYTLKYDPELINVEIKGNTLIITGFEVGEASIKFIHRDNKSDIKDEFYISLDTSRTRFLVSNGFHPNNFELILHFIPTPVNEESSNEELIEEEIKHAEKPNIINSEPINHNNSNQAPGAEVVTPSLNDYHNNLPSVVETTKVPSTSNDYNLNPSSLIRYFSILPIFFGGIATWYIKKRFF